MSEQTAPTYQHEITLEVRDYECDLQGVVNNAIYLHYLEHARHCWLLSLGLDFVAMHHEGTDLVVARIEIPTRTDLGSTIASLWDVSAPDGKVTLTVPQVELPEALRTELAQANSTHARWEPTTRELQDLRDG